MTLFEEAEKRGLSFPAQDRVDGYAGADQVYAVADAQAVADYYAATDAADSGHREQTADDRGEYEVGMFARHAGQMSVALSGVLALPASSPIQELLLTYRSGTAVHDTSLADAVHDASLADAVRAVRNDYQTLLTPAYAAATAADGLADVAFQWTDDVSAAQDVLQQPGVGPADGQYASYLTTMAHQARETEIRLAREAYVAAIAGGQTARADDLGTAEDAFATALNAAGSAYASAVNTAESSFTVGTGSAGMSHVQGLVNADALYSNSLAGSFRNLTGQLGNADVFLTHALGTADVGYRNATAPREAAYQVGLAQRQESVLASWSHPDSLFQHARASAERVFLQGTQTAYATFASNQAQADADRDTAWAQAGANHQVRQADADILHTAQLGVNDVGHTVGVAASHQDVFDHLTTLVNARRSQLFTPYQSAATAEAADGHAYAVGLADAEGAYQIAVAAARRAYQQAAAPIENQFAFAVYQAECNYQAALTAQDLNAWSQY